MTTLSLPAFGLLAVPLTGLYVAAALAQGNKDRARRNPTGSPTRANVIVWLQCRRAVDWQRWSIEADELIRGRSTVQKSTPVPMTLVLIAPPLFLDYPQMGATCPILAVSPHSARHSSICSARPLASGQIQ